MALWSANAGMKAIIDALNVVYDEKEKRSFVKLNLLSLLFTLVAVLALMVARRHSGRSDPFFRRRSFVCLQPCNRRSALAVVADPCNGRPGLDLSVWAKPHRSALAMAFGRERRRSHRVADSSVLFSWYIANFGAYNATYGSLGAAVGMMMWMWISAIVILLGGELNAEIEHQTARDPTVGSEKPLGQRGAVAADTIGAARS